LFKLNLFSYTMSKRYMQTNTNIERAELKGNPFGVPDGYFELLPQQVKQGVSKGTRQVKMEISQGKRRLPFEMTAVRYQLAYAASIVLFIGLGYGLIQLVMPDRSDADFPYSENISLFKAYTLLHHDDAEESYDSEQIITFLTEHGISPNAIAVLD